MISAPIREPRWPEDGCTRAVSLAHGTPGDSDSTMGHGWTTQKSKQTRFLSRSKTTISISNFRDTDIDTPAPEGGELIAVQHDQAWAYCTTPGAGISFEWYANFFQLTRETVRDAYLFDGCVLVGHAYGFMARGLGWTMRRTGSHL